jgi:hypothetical protein
MIGKSLRFKSPARESFGAALRVMVTIALSLCASWVHADKDVLAPHAAVAGKSIGQWSGDWWAAVVADPSADSPFVSDVDQPGALGNVGGPVFFAVASPGPGTTTYTYTVPPDQYVLVPLYTYSWNWMLPTDPCGNFACALKQSDLFVSKTDQLSVSIDGKAVHNLFHHYAATPHVYTATAPVDGWWAGGDPEFAGLWFGVTSGYWLMLEPLSPGTHVIEVAVHAPFQQVCADGSDQCDIPVPGPLDLSQTTLVLTVLCNSSTHGLAKRCTGHL